jgi:competence protein ComEA
MGPHFTNTTRRIAAAQDLAAAGDRMRRRAEALLAAKSKGTVGAAAATALGRFAAPTRGNGGSRPPAASPPAARFGQAGADAAARAMGRAPAGAHAPAPGPGGGGLPVERLRRAREAVCDRLPTWVRLRCGLEPRTVVALGAALAVAGALAVHHYVSTRPHTVSVPPLASAAHARPDSEEQDRGGEGVENDVPTGKQAGTFAGGAQAFSGSAGSATGGTMPSPGGVVVDVAGKVRSPGVLRLPAGSRVADALKAAGGTLRGADTTSLNLARLLVDGEQVLVGVPQPAPAMAPSAGSTAASGPVSLTTGTIEQLDALPGIGPVLAQHIVDFRLRHGGFRSVAQLRQVPGVGDRRFGELRDLVRP